MEQVPTGYSVNPSSRQFAGNVPPSYQQITNMLPPGYCNPYAPNYMNIPSMQGYYHQPQGAFQNYGGPNIGNMLPHNYNPTLQSPSEQAFKLQNQDPSKCYIKPKQQVCVPEDKTRKLRIMDTTSHRGPVITPTTEKFCNLEYVSDEFGEGIRAKNTLKEGEENRRSCCIPMTKYQKYHGELAKEILTNQRIVERNIMGEPPCSFCESEDKIFKQYHPCRGYYRPQECIPKEDYDRFKVDEEGNKVYVDKVKRYWDDKISPTNYADLAGTNIPLLNKLREKSRQKYGEPPSF